MNDCVYRDDLLQKIERIKRAEPLLNTLWAEQLIEASKAADIVTLEDHERMKRELHSEIERFKQIETTVNEFWCVLQKFSREKLKEKPTLEELLEYIEHAKAEAIKEFTKRLLEAIREHHYLLSDHCNSRDYGMFTVGIEQAICETKKEMVGDTK